MFAQAYSLIHIHLLIQSFVDQIVTLDMISTESTVTFMEKALDTESC